MKKLLSIFFSCVLFLFMSCEPMNYKGEMTYRQGFTNTLNSIVSETGSELSETYLEILLETEKINSEYQKEWVLEYAGYTLEEGLKEADKKALEDFNAAVADMTSLSETYKEKLKTAELGKGSFKLVYKFGVYRDTKVKESEDIIFEYPVPEDKEETKIIYTNIK